MKIRLARLTGEFQDLEVADVAEVVARCSEIFGLRRRKLLVDGEELGDGHALQEGCEVLVVDVAGPLGLVTTTSGEVQVFEAEDGRMLGRFQVSEPDVMVYACFSPDSTKLATCSEAGEARLFTLQGELLHVLPGQTWEKKDKKTKVLTTSYSPVRYAAFSADGSLLATVSFNLVQVWSVSTGTLMHSCDTVKRCGRVSFSHDGAALAASVTYGGPCGFVFEMKTGQVQATLEGKGGFQIECSPVDERVLIISSQAVRVWTLLGEKIFDVESDEENWFREAAFRKTQLLVAYSLLNVKIFDASGELLKSLPGIERDLFLCAAFSERHVAVMHQGGGVKLWDLETEELLELPRDDDFGNTSVDWGLAFHDGQLAVTEASYRRVSLWDMQGQRLASWEVGEEDGPWIQSMQLSASHTW